ncbi:MAG TPA: D-glycero-beta-D-manno-heptose 1-phosphate adenylyltransferase [Rhodanobacteraceae bacterium]|nr:D-glycero-beta-D-manno-heptose 1-phosphate adenylyltransferase [Rhodanobacteraceae bacterium]
MADPCMTAMGSNPDRAFLARMFARAHNLTVWVIGDLMLDEYAIGDAERISPEAPVPVVRVRQVSEHLGGAANVACQVAMFGARVAIAGLAGTDPAGDRLLALCRSAGIDTGAVRRLSTRQTSRKLRGLARHQQLVRLDWEDTASCPADEALHMLECLREGDKPDVIILSDYAKGVLTPALIDGVRAIANATGAPVVVDPKQRDFGSYRGASVATPNLRELEAATGRTCDPADIESVATCAQALAVRAGIDALVVTLSEHGLLIVTAGGTWQSIPARARTLFDPTGAGDTVVAVLATLLAAGASLADAARIANTAAGIAVGSVGTVSVTADAIIGSLVGEESHKVRALEQLAIDVRGWREAGQRIVFTNGCFDLLHMGHLELLREAARQGDILIVAVNGDASVRRLKGPARPLVPAGERAAMLAALSCVDAVTIFDEDTPLAVLQAVRPDVLVKGQDYRVEQVVGRELVESGGGRVMLVPLTPGKSTTALVEHIAHCYSAR